MRRVEWSEPGGRERKVAAYVSTRANESSVAVQESCCEWRVEGGGAVVECVRVCVRGSEISHLTSDEHDLYGPV